MMGINIHSGNKVLLVLIATRGTIINSQMGSREKPTVNFDLSFANENPSIQTNEPGPSSLNTLKILHTQNKNLQTIEKHGNTTKGSPVP